MKLRVFAFGFMLCFCVFAVQSRAQQVGLHDMVNVNVTGAPGTGPFTLGTAIPPYLGFAAVATSGETISYAAQDGAGNWERGRGAWTSGGVGGTLARGVKTSSNGNGLVSFGSGVTVFNAALAEDMVSTTYPSSVLALITVPACAPSTTIGNITLTLNACANPVTPAIGGSPLKWHIGPLTGDGTLIWSNPTVGQEFIMEIAANGHNLTLPSFVGPAGGVSGNSFLVCDVFDSAPTYWCPAGVQSGLGTGLIFVAGSQCQSAGGAGADCTTNPVSMTSANLIVVAVAYFNGGAGTVAAPTDNVSVSNTYTLGVTSSIAADIALKCYYSFAPTVSGSMTFTAVSSGGQTFEGIAVAGFSGAVASPLDQTNTSTATGVTSASSGSVTPTQANELIVGCFGLASGSAQSGLATSGGYTLGGNIPSNGTVAEGAAIVYLPQTIAAASNPPLSWNGPGDVPAGTMSFK